MILELEKRSRLEPAEYGALLQECYNTWFISRMSLLATPLAEEVRRMDPTNSDLIKLVRSAIYSLGGPSHIRPDSYIGSSRL